MTADNNNGDRWRGRRCICLVRQSSDADGTTSTEAQLQWLHADAHARGMTNVADVTLEGVTGSLPGMRTDLEDLLNRKREQDDFDVLLVQRLDRLTRGGSEHGFWFEHEANKVGIDILYPGDDLPKDSRYSSLIKVAKLEAARDQARSIGQRSVQGSMYSVAQGRNCVVSRTPYACDRLYLSADGVPLFIIRNLADGRQQKLSPDGVTVIDTYGSVGGGTKGHYRKQKNECVQLVPGAHDLVEVVRTIFDLHYAQRQGGKRIADLLNRRGVPSPTGRGWSQRQVESIYENPVYTGQALGGRASQGIYYRHGKDRPEALNLPQRVLANCRTAPRQLRPPAEWCWQEQPLMKGFLPADLAAKALPQITLLHETRWARSQDPTCLKRSPSKHKASQYILTGLLFAKQDGADLTGVMCGRSDRRTRYYRHRRKNVGYLKGSVYNRMIPAAPLERAVLELIREVIVDAPAIRERVLAAVRVTSASAATQQELESLQQHRAEIAEKVQLLVRNLDAATLKDAQPVLDRLSQQREELERQIVEAQQALQYAAEDPEALADRVVARLAVVGQGLMEVTPAVLRDLMEAFIERVEVDMETKDILVGLKLPAWALEAEGVMRLAHSSPSSTARETHRSVLVPLGTAECPYAVVSSRVCYRCRRRKTPAA